MSLTNDYFLVFTHTQLIFLNYKSIETGLSQICLIDGRIFVQVTLGGK
jgi:hypothetical protein